MRRVVYRPRRKLLSAAKRGDPGAREKLAEAVMPRTAPVRWLCRATPTVQRQESSQQVVVGLLEAPRRKLAAGARHSRTSP